jgi:hypothetical protein
VALAGVELEEVARTCSDGLPSGRRDIYLAVDDDDPRPLVHLVLLQLLPGRETEHDRSRVLSGSEDLRLVWLRFDGLQVPALHRPCCTTQRLV